VGRIDFGVGGLDEWIVLILIVIKIVVVIVIGAAMAKTLILSL